MKNKIEKLIETFIELLMEDIESELRIRRYYYDVLQSLIKEGEE